MLGDTAEICECRIELGTEIGMGVVLGRVFLEALPGRGGDLGSPCIEPIGLDAEFSGDGMGRLAAVEPAADGVLPEGGIVAGPGCRQRAGFVRGRWRDWGRILGTFRAHGGDAVFDSVSVSSESRQPQPECAPVHQR